MKSTKFAQTLAVSLALSWATAAGAAPSSSFTVPEKEPADISMDSGLEFSYSTKCQKEFADSVGRAKNYCQEYQAKHKDQHLCVVSDLDETLLDNREHFKTDRTKTWSLFEAWINEAQAPLLKPTAEFLSWARDKGFAVFFISGRPEKDRSGTIRNLVRDKISYDGLYLRPDGSKGPAEDFKARARKEIEEMGFTVVESIGDQFSDLAGGHAMDCEKLPNRMYFIQ
ncbi:MAG: HAD family acid phosphatase [Terriglobales bacterium]